MAKGPEQHRIIIAGFSEFEKVFYSRATMHWEHDAVANEPRQVASIEVPPFTVEMSQRYPVKPGRDSIELYVKKAAAHPTGLQRFSAISLGVKEVGLLFWIVGDLAVLSKYIVMTSMLPHRHEHKWWELEGLSRALGGRRRFLNSPNLGLPIAEPFNPEVELRKLLSGELA
jgi:hypothetical protein